MTRIKSRNVPGGFFAVGAEHDIYVNNQGHVYNPRTGSISTAHSHGKVTVHSYSQGGVEYSFHLARAVAENFVPIPRELVTVPARLREISYIDGNKKNCAASNLRWVASRRYKPIVVVDNAGHEHSFTSVLDAWGAFGKSSYRAFCMGVKKGFLKSHGISFKNAS